MRKNDTNNFIWVIGILSQTYKKMLAICYLRTFRFAGL